MQAMTCTRTLLCDSWVRPTTHNPAHILQIQSRCYVLAMPSLLPSSVLSPSLWKTTEIKLPKTYDWNGFLQRCWREKHITSCNSLSLATFFPFDWIAVPNEGSLIHLSCGVESRQRSSPSPSLSPKWFIFLLQRWACEMSYIINSIGL